MEIKESAACGISEREFEVDLEDDEIETMLNFVKGAVEAENLDEETMNPVMEKLQEGMSEGEVTLEFKEEAIAKFYKGLKAAQDGGVDVDEDFSDDLFSYMEQVVGAALNE
jgi:hypothetical protein